MDYIARQSSRVRRNLFLWALPLLTIAAVFFFSMTNGYAGAIPFLLMASPLLYFCLAYTLGPPLNPILRKLAKMGSIDTLRKQIETEVKADPVSFGPAIVTENWILVPSATRLEFTRFKDVFSSRLQQTVTTQTNGVATSQVTYAVFMTRFGDLKVPLNSSEEIRRFLSYVSARRELEGE